MTVTPTANGRYALSDGHYLIVLAGSSLVVALALVLMTWSVL